MLRSCLINNGMVVILCIKNCMGAGMVVSALAPGSSSFVYRLLLQADWFRLCRSIFLELWIVGWMKVRPLLSDKNELREVLKLRKDLSFVLGLMSYALCVGRGRVAGWYMNCIHEYIYTIYLFPNVRADALFK